jgi:hypothetical protein
VVQTRKSLILLPARPTSAALRPGSVLDGSVAEVDPAQIAIYRCLEPFVGLSQGCSISNTARQAVSYRLRQRRPTKVIRLADLQRHRQVLVFYHVPALSQAVREGAIPAVR